MTTSIQSYIAAQNGLRGPNSGIEPDFDASGGALVAGENAVIGFQSVSLGAGANGVIGNAMVLDGPRSQYAINVDATGLLNVHDTTAGQSVASSGIAYVVFDGGASNVAGTGYASIAFIENATGSEIAALYQAALGRIPDLQGLEYWQAQSAAGMSMQTIAQDFLTSTEFTAKIINPITSTDAQFVAALYQNVLNRAGDPTGVTYWLGQLSTAESTAGYNEVATRATVTLGFTNSAENLNNISATNGGWLIDTAQGGYADAANPIPAATALTQGLADKYINLANISASAAATTGSAATGYAQIGGSEGQALGLGNNTGVTVYLASQTINTVYDSDSGDSIYGSTGGNSNIIVSTGSNVYLSGNANHVAAGFGGSTSLGSIVYSFNSTDTVMLGPWSNITSSQVLTPTAAAPLSGSAVNFSTAQGGGGSSAGFITVVQVGAVGGGTMAEVASAANKVYTAADVVHETIIFAGETSSGNAVLAYWGSSQIAQTTQADTNGNHQVDASEITASLTLVGIQATSLTAANFHS